MSSSSETVRVFEGVRWPNVLVLLDTLARSSVRSSSHLERLYRENATNFSATTRLLIEAGLLDENDGQLLLSGLMPSEATARRDVVLEGIVQSKVADSLFAYVAKFRPKGEEILAVPDPSTAAGDSAVRNLLIEMGLVRYRDTDRVYVLAPSHAWLFAIARSSVRPTKPKTLMSRLSQQEDIGWIAERAVYEAEQRRVGQVLVDRVIHVSEVDVAAGYDIRSVTVEGEKCTPRFIEVKAVPAQSLRFYWTENEIEVARSLGPHYFLYLVPVRGGKPDIERVEMIQAPCSAVLGGDNWEVESNVVRCQLRGTDSKESAAGK